MKEELVKSRSFIDGAVIPVYSYHYREISMWQSLKNIDVGELAKVEIIKDFTEIVDYLEDTSEVCYLSNVEDVIINRYKRIIQISKCIVDTLNFNSTINYSNSIRKLKEICRYEKEILETFCNMNREFNFTAFKGIIKMKDSIYLLEQPLTGNYFIIVLNLSLQQYEYYKELIKSINNKLETKIEISNSIFQ